MLSTKRLIKLWDICRMKFCEVSTYDIDDARHDLTGSPSLPQGFSV